MEVKDAVVEDPTLDSSSALSPGASCDLPPSPFPPATSRKGPQQIMEHGANPITEIPPRSSNTGSSF
jgi:hypothetical protein